MRGLTGVLLVNLGTPDSPSPRDVRRYLDEFLMDPRVIDEPWLKRALLVKGIIIPRRYKQSAASYQAIWTGEGSPLMVYGRRVEKLLSDCLGEGFTVSLAMRYQNPSIRDGLKILMEKRVDRLVILPLFPQYASATTGSVHEKVMDELKRYPVIPETLFLDRFAEHPAFLDACAAIGSEYDLKSYDHILFSFHGLPERQLKKSDASCLQVDCCSRQKKCYKAECLATAKGIATRLGINSYKLAFQSRLGKEPWLQPYASDVIHDLAAQGAKRVLAFCPSFVCDCLETLFEYGEEYQKEFQAAGGERLDLVRGLNDDPRWVNALAEILSERLSFS